MSRVVGRQRRMIGAMARHRVQVLHAAGLPQARIAAIEGISERSVRTICGEAPIADPRDVGPARGRGVEALVRSLLHGFESFGGVPLVAVFDNPKTVVLNREGGRIQWNDTFGQTALDYRFAPELCTPRRGQEKGSAENLVGFVKNGFFKVRRFHDRADMLVQLAAWHLEVNTVRPCRATGVPPAERIAAERERMRPLAIPAA